MTVSLKRLPGGSPADGRTSDTHEQRSGAAEGSAAHKQEGDQSAIGFVVFERCSEGETAKMRLQTNASHNLSETNAQWAGAHTTR